jgi:hypothetical protein
MLSFCLVSDENTYPCYCFFCSFRYTSMRHHCKLLHLEDIDQSWVCLHVLELHSSSATCGMDSPAYVYYEEQKVQG